MPTSEPEPQARREPEPTVEPDWPRSILRCPSCGSELADATGPGGAELLCVGESCGLAYPVDDGVPVLLLDEARATRP